jgi:hypothetical protein
MVVEEPFGFFNFMIEDFVRIIDAVGAVHDELPNAPGLTSILWIVFEKPFGPHHCAMWIGSVHTCHTSSRGASKPRVMEISRSAVLVTAAFLSFRILFLLDW